MTRSDDTRPATGLRERTLSSVFWILASNAVRALVLFLVPAGIAWLTGPVELGLVQLAYAVYMVALPFVTLGTRAAVVQRPDPSQAFLSSVFFLNILTGSVTGAALILAAPWLALIGEGDPRLVTAIRWIGVACAVSALTVVPAARLARQLAFRIVSLASIGGAIVGVAAGVAAFAWGGTLMAMGVAAGMYLLVNTCVLWMAGRWRPSLAFDAGEAIAAMGFGVTASLASFAGNLAQQVERFLLSALFGPAALGLYGAARNLNRDALRNLMRVTDEVLLPGLAAMQPDAERAAAYYLEALRYEFLVFAPAAVFVFVFARDLVLLVYGPAWLDVVPLVLALTPLTLFTITNHTLGAVFLSQGRPGLQLRWSLLSIVLVAAWVVAGSPWGLVGAVTALSVLDGVGWVISHGMANSLLRVGWPAFLRNLSVPAAAAGALGGVLAALRHVTGSTQAASWPDIAAWALAALVVYVVLLRVLDRELSRGFWRAIGDVVRLPSVTGSRPHP